jgi:hypothetical protein
MKYVPGTPENQTPLWLEPDPYYGPKDQAQDIRGREMEKKYTGTNLSRYDKLQFERQKKKMIANRDEALKAFKEKLNELNSQQDKS